MRLFLCKYYNCRLTKDACRKRKELAAYLAKNLNGMRTPYISNYDLFDSMRWCVDACRKHPDIVPVKIEPPKRVCITCGKTLPTRRQYIQRTRKCRPCHTRHEKAVKERIAKCTT